MASPGPLEQPAFTWLRDLLWPDDGGGASIAEYAVLSRGDRPRLVVPVGSRRATATALSRVTGDETARRQAMRRVLATLARGGALQPALRHRFHSVATRGITIESYLANVLGTSRVELAVTIGPARPNRKPVIQIMTPDGAAIAYAKVGWNGLTRRLVAQEAAALRSLDRSALRRLIIPEIAHVGEWRGLELLVLTAIEAPRDETIARRDPTPAEIDELRSTRPSRLVSLPADPYWRRLLERATGVGGDVGAEIEAAALRITKDLAGDPVSIGGGHGDWTPWNMVATDRHLRVWDWERAIDPVPFPLDVIHYHAQRGWFRSSLSLERALLDSAGAARRALAQSGLHSPHADSLVTLYLAELSLRFAENATAGTDELLSARHAEIRRALRASC